MKECAVFAGGKIEDLSFIDAYEIAESCFMVICADSGYEYAKRLGIIPDLIVGDFDSYRGELPEDIEVLRSVPEKDDTDTILAVKIAAERGAERIRLYGGMGARADHAFANIQSMIYAYENNMTLKIIDEANELEVLGAGEHEFDYREKWYLSLFSLTEKADIACLCGVKYPLENEILSQSFPLGVSNEITADKAFLNIRSGLVLVIRSKMN